MDSSLEPHIYLQSSVQDDPEIKPVEIQQLMEAGMNIVRLRLPHLTTDDKILLLGKIDKAAEKLCSKYVVEEWPVATCIDLKTCIVKTGMIEGVSILLTGCRASI